MTKLTALFNWDQITRHFYGIHGELDEFRKARIDQLASRGFILLQTYLIANSLILLILLATQTKWLLGLVCCNLIVIFWTIHYITKALEDDDVLTEEVHSKQLSQRLKKAKRQANLNALFLFALFHLTTPLFPWRKQAYWTAITDPASLINSLIYTFIYWRINLYRLKKHIKPLPDEDD